MARFSQPAFDFYHQTPSALDQKPQSASSYPEDDDMSVLDDKILDSTSPDLTSVADHRRHSYEHGPEAYQHRDSVWSDFSQSVSSNQSRHSSHVAHPFFESPHAPYMRMDNGLPYGQAQPWTMTKDSGSCTPSAMYDHYSTDMDNTSVAPFAGGAVGPVNTVNMPSMSYRQHIPFAPPGAVAMSPQSSQGWMPASTDMPDPGSRPKNSPTYRNSSPLSVRRDGIRKKNARFEIPAERTLSNIDTLISQSTNEDEIKELKQQKRLLRNRQAALDSRQRKKQHTEKLEEEKKRHMLEISELEDALQSLRLREQEHAREKNEWLTIQQEMVQYINSQQVEKDELIRVHTLETAELRKKNNILKETVEKLERHARSNVTNDFGDFENLTMESSPWEDFTMVNGLSLDTEPVAPQPSQAMVVATSDKAEKAANADYPFSWNAFYMCLLFGAFIASNSTSLPARSLPRLSEEYRAESANVLKAVLSSSPPELAHSSANHPAVSASAGPLPTTITGAEMAQMTGAAPTSNLDELHNTLAMPTKEQEQEQVFALNAEQYNSLTTFDETGAGYKSQQPSNLQQALAAMRGNAARARMPHKATSDVYSRSLMWDRVPEKVIRDFQRMVSEYGASPAREENPGFNQA
ncbi:Putative BZIP transcription factor [Aspergillus calidoustus]|uniref:Putative BZIP transcription factor n=1 Tax=Aspergillus calidoustus TaxID=454130 RepID=A0A0U5G9T7_ASPCI|nr:Putative BZIP transcription factor [Aspergillus calidoustus]